MADDRTVQLTVSLATGDAVQKTKELENALNGLGISAEKVVVSQEKVGRAFAAGSADRMAASLDKGERATMQLANGLEKLLRLEQQGEVTEQRRAQIIDLLAERYKREQAAIEAKAEAERKAAQASAAAADGEKRALDQSLASIDKNYAAELRLSDAVKTAANLRQAGRIGLVEEIALRDKAQTSYINETKALTVQEAAMRKSATSTGLARYELINLSRQIQDVGVSLSGGQSPLRVLVEQGSQIADIFISSKASIVSFFGQLGTWLSSSKGLIIGFVTAVATIGIGALAAASSWASAQRDIQRALLGIGAASGATVGDINKIAAASSSATKISTSEAQEAASTYASTGKIYRDNIQKATDLTYNFSKAIGKDTTEAAKELSAALADPIKGIEQLEKQFGAIDGITRGYIRTLYNSGQEQKAQQVLLDTFNPKIDKAAQLTSIWARAWDFVSKKASEAYTAVGKVADRLTPSTAQDRLANVQDQIAGLEAAGGGARSPRAIRGRPSSDIADLQKLRAEEEQLKGVIAAQNAELEKQRLAQWAKEGEAAIRETIPQIAQLEVLQRRLTELQRVDPSSMQSGGSAKAAIQAVQLLTQLTQEAKAQEEARVAAVLKLVGAYTAAKGSAIELLTADQNHVKVIQNTEGAAKVLTIETIKQVSALNDQIKIAQARTGEEKLLATEKARTTQLTQEGKSAEEAALIASKERKLAIEQANASIDEQIRSIRQAMEMEQARLDGTEAATAAAQAYANALRQGADAAHAAALAAAVLAQAMQKAEIAAENMAQATASARADAAGMASGGIGTLGGTHSSGQGVGIIIGGRAIGAQSLGDPKFAIYFEQYMKEQKRTSDILAAMKAEAETSLATRTPGSQEYIAAQQRAAQAQEEAARAALQAAEAMQAAAEELRQQNNLKFQNIAAQYLINGVNPLQINAMIESGQIARYDPSTTFQTQLDLYKRGGVSNERTRADILSGIIGEGVAPTEILAALDGLTTAVTSNTAATEAQTVGLSPFYSQQGDRLLGYRGYSVNNSPSTTTGTGTTSTGGTGTTSTGGGIPYGGVVNGGMAGTGASVGGTLQLINGQWVQTSSYNTYTGLPTAGFTPTAYNPYAGSSTWTSPYFGSGGYRQMADGGVATSPTYGVFGEAGPEAFVPLKGGKIPVHLAGGFPGNDNAPVATALPAMLTALFAAIANKLDNAAQRAPININAPLVSYGHEPSGDRARETAFQSGQLLRRVIASAA